MATDTESLQAEVAQLRSDTAFLNTITGLGYLGRDKMTGFDIAGIPDLSPEKLATLYRVDTFAGNIVELLPDAATKKWVKYSHEGSDPAGVEGVQMALDKLKGPINEAMILARLYGGAVIVLGADDGAVNFWEPLNLDNLRAVRWHTVMSKERIRPIEWGENPTLEDYDRPVIYQLTDKGQTKVHASRLLRFDGVKLPAEILRQNNGWGDSALMRPYRDMVAFEGSLATIASAVQDFEIAVIESANLVENTAKVGGDAAVKSRLAQVAYARNVLGAMLMEAGKEKYSLVSRNFTGIPELLDKLREVFIGSTDLPPSKLMALFTSAGLSQEDTTQQREWSDFVLSRQEDDLRPILEQYLKLIHLSKEGPTGGQTPLNPKLEFEPIFQLNEQERTKLEAERAKEWEVYLKYQVVTPDEVAEALSRNVPLGTVIDLNARIAEAQSLEKFPEGYAPAGGMA